MNKLQVAYNSGYKMGLAAMKYSGSDEKRPYSTFDEDYEPVVHRDDIANLEDQTGEVLSQYKWLQTIDEGEHLYEVWGSKDPQFADNATFELVYRK